MGVELSNFARPIDAPARGAFAVTKSDVTVFDNQGPNNPPARAIYVGGTGDLVVRMVDGSIVTFNVQFTSVRILYARSGPVPVPV